jgi:hypothetical protein
MVPFSSFSVSQSRTHYGKFNHLELAKLRAENATQTKEGPTGAKVKQK